MTKTPEQFGYEQAIRLAKAARTAHARLIEPIREAARAKGYAVAVHGSLARDVDLVAVPWTAKAVSAGALLRAVLRTVKALDPDAYLPHVAADKRPHGRASWSIHLTEGTWIDLSVMPREGDR